MLVLTRRLGERIYVGDDIILEVRKIGETQVKIGIVAPKSMRILREEIYDKIKEECSGEDKQEEQSTSDATESLAQKPLVVGARPSTCSRNMRIGYATHCDRHLQEHPTPSRLPMGDLHEPE